jgi:cytochrome c556
MHWRPLCAIALVLSVLSSVAAHEGATGVVRERMDAMESMTKAMKAIDQRIKQKGDLEAVKTHAKSIQEDAVKMPSLFPPGTGKHPSEATAKVWQNWPDFEAKARALATESGKLAEVDIRDLKALNAQALRVSDVCGDCHELYRAKRHGHRH